MFMGFVIWSVAAFIFLLIGISVRKSREAAGFYTFAKNRLSVISKMEYA